MSAPLKKLFTRRRLFQSGGVLGAMAALPAPAAPASSGIPETAGRLQLGPDIYKSIGVKPLINCRGTFTIISGSLELPEVRAAQQAAAQHFVQLDELMEAIGRRLAEITGAENGLVSSGCAAAIVHATSACVTGGNPDLHTRVPDLTGFPKDEVVIPKHSRNVYDQAVRSVGVRVVEAGTPEEYAAALGPRVAMVYVLAGEGPENGPLTYDVLYREAAKRNIPVLTDAAAEKLSIPNVHLTRGATMVCYSGGKALRGPQSAGLLLGRKDLVKAAWVSSAPHHGHGRSMKVGKEEAMAMPAAVEMWVRRDHDAEDRMWTAWMNNIAGRVTKVEGVSTSLVEPKGLNNHSPGLTITWDPARLGITGQEVATMLDTTEPRISLNAVGGRRSDGGDHSGVSITAYMMQSGDDKVVGERLFEILSAKRPPKSPHAPQPPSGDMNGRWDVAIQYAAGSSNHVLHVTQHGNSLVGTHQGDFIARDLRGSVDGDKIQMTSNVGENHGAAIGYRFEGTLQGDTMSGTVDLGEYLGATWTARRHAFGARG